MRCIAIVCCLCAGLVTLAAAQADPDPDGIGIYADLAATEVSIEAQPGEILPVYLVLTRPSQSPGIACWSAMVVAPLNAQILAWNVQGSSFLNFASPPEFNVCFQDPFPTSDRMHLMTFYVQMTNALPGYFRVVGSPIAGEPFSEAPCYLMPDDVETPHFLHGFPNGTAQPMFAVNDELTPVESHTLSEVRSLFR